jgi:hypothetical protein
MFYIYEKSSTLIMGPYTVRREVRPDHRKSYKTMAAAKAALTRWTKWWQEDLNYPGSAECQDNNPQFRYAIAEAGYFHKTIEKKRTTYSIFDEDKDSPLVEGVNVPNYMSPRSEAYWSM